MIADIILLHVSPRSPRAYNFFFLPLSLHGVPCPNILIILCHVTLSLFSIILYQSVFSRRPLICMCPSLLPLFPVLVLLCCQTASVTQLSHPIHPSNHPGAVFLSAFPFCVPQLSHPSRSHRVTFFFYWSFLICCCVHK
jgi:hypothetical protein